MNPKNLILQAAQLRSKVSQSGVVRQLKDKALLGGVVLVLGVTLLIGVLPKHKKAEQAIPEDKQTPSQIFTQNRVLFESMKESQIKPEPEVHHAIKLSKEVLARMNAPSTLYVTEGQTTSSQAENSTNTLTGKDTNSQFLNQQNDIASVQAKRLPHPKETIPAGEMIAATLETAINSELAGMVRAITSEDVYALSGGKLLIPKGSTLVGQFNANVHQGQSRVFVVWNRVQLTSGVIITLNSPSSDAIGRAGQGADSIDRHFIERFGNGVLFSVLGAYTAVGGVNGQDEYNSLSQYRMNVAGGFQQAASQTLQQDMKSSPTLQVNQGALIHVFVAHDLDFHGVRG